MLTNDKILGCCLFESVIVLVHPAASDSEHAQSDPRPSLSRYVSVSPVKSRGRRQTRGFECHKEDTTCKKIYLIQFWYMVINSVGLL